MTTDLGKHWDVSKFVRTQAGCDLKPSEFTGNAFQARIDRRCLYLSNDRVNVDIVERKSWVEDYDDDSAESLNRRIPATGRSRGLSYEIESHTTG